MRSNLSPDELDTLAEALDVWAAQEPLGLGKVLIDRAAAAGQISEARRQRMQQEVNVQPMRRRERADALKAKLRGDESPARQP